MGYKISILMPCSEAHKSKAVRLLTDLSLQHSSEQIEFRPLFNRGELTKGEYRNMLLDMAQGEYVCFVDADDRVAPDYIETLLKAIETKQDCVSLRGEFRQDGGSAEVFEHSLKYSKWQTVDGPIKYLRTPNHLNCIRADIAKSVKFDHVNFSEDHIWSRAIHPLLKTEVYVDKVLYYYDYISK